jgi:hypothetical protein
MNTHATRITVGVSLVALAAAVSLSMLPYDKHGNPSPSAADMSVPSASEALRKQDGEKKPAEGNVQDMTY